MQPNDTVTIVSVTYNSAAHIRPFLESVQKQTYPHCELLILENASSDHTAQILETEAPWAKVVHLPETLATVGQLARIHDVHEPADFDLNDDVVLEPTCVAELVRALQQNPDAAITCPLITLYDEPDVVNTVGNRLAITGFYSARGKGQTQPDFHNPRSSPPFPAVASCIAALCISRSEASVTISMASLRLGMPRMRMSTFPTGYALPVTASYSNPPQCCGTDMFRNR